jgi:hypothetical protein
VTDVTAPPPASLPLFALAAAFALTGCTTYRDQAQSATLHWQAGNVQGAAQEFTRGANKDRERDAIIWRLEQGAALRAAWRYQESNSAFDAAEARIEQHDAGPRVHLGSEATALISNLASLPYEGRGYDRVMLNTYKALNHLQLGEPDKARVEFNRVLKRQEEARALKQRRIERAESELSSLQPVVRDAVRQAREHPQLRTALSFTGRFHAEGLYVNPFATWAFALFHLANAGDAADLERAHKAFEQALAASPEKRFVQADLDLVKARMAGQPMPELTWIIFETGRAPMRDEVKVELPLLVTRLSYIGMAFPKLVFVENYASSLTVTAGGVTEHTGVVADMDAIVARDFQDELPVIVTKTLVSAALKATATYTINTEAEHRGEWTGLLAKLGTALTQMAINIADTRTWTTLPKQVQIARVPTPSDRKLSLYAPASGQRADVTVGTGRVNIVFVKSVSPSTPMLVSHATLP